MTSEAEAKYKGAFWKFVAFLLAITTAILSIAFIIALYVIITGPPTVQDILEKSKPKGGEIVLHEQDERITNDGSTFYNVLHVDPDASMDEIAHSYHKLAKIWHPDRNKDNNHPNAEKIFCRIAEAYGTLHNPQKRAEYDMKLHQNGMFLETI